MNIKSTSLLFVLSSISLMASAGCAATDDANASPDDEIGEVGTTA